MSWLVTGMILLIGIHLVPSFPALRRRLVNMQGMTAYQVGFDLIALLGLMLFDMLSANLRGARKQQQAVSAGHETLVVSGGIIAYLALLYLHPLLFGVSAI